MMKSDWFCGESSTLSREMLSASVAKCLQYSLGQREGRGSNPGSATCPYVRGVIS